MSYEELLRIDCKIYKKILIVVFGIIIIFLLLLNMNFYDVYNTKGYITNNNLILNIPYNYSDTIANGKYLKINNIKYNLKIIRYIASKEYRLSNEGNNYIRYRIKL